MDATKLINEAFDEIDRIVSHGAMNISEMRSLVLSKFEEESHDSD